MSGRTPWARRWWLASRLRESSAAPPGIPSCVLIWSIVGRAAFATGTSITTPPTKTSHSTRYAIEREIGRGGLAVVYAAVDTESKVEVALKVLESTAPAAKERLLREGRAQSRLRHPHLVELHRVVEVDGKPALVLERVEGGTLEGWRERHPDADFHDVEPVFRKVCKAVSFAHVHGVVHRDLKPANILLTQAGEPKVGDFGIAKVLDQIDVTEHGAVLGTMGFMSPEQMRDTARVDARSDVWALGCLLYHMLVGRAPFDGKDLIEIHRRAVEGEWERPAGVPRRCIDALESALSPDLKDRAQSVEALLLVLDGDERPADNVTWHGSSDDHFYRRTVRRDEVSDAAWARFVESCERMPTLVHPGIPHTLDVSVTGDEAKLMVTRPAGSDLRSHHAGTRLGEEEVRRILRGLVDVLAWTHRQVPPVVHGRLQPDTVHYGERLVSISGWDETGDEPREPGFAPEGETPSPATDIYAVGALAVYLLTRSPPRFREGTHHIDWSGLAPPDEELVQLIEEALDPDPTARPPAAVVRTLLEAHDPHSHDTMSLTLTGIAAAIGSESLSPTQTRSSEDMPRLGFGDDGGATDPVTLLTGAAILLATAGAGLAVWVLINL